MGKGQGNLEPSEGPDDRSGKIPGGPKIWPGRIWQTGNETDKERRESLWILWRVRTFGPEDRPCPHPVARGRRPHNRPRSRCRKRCGNRGRSPSRALLPFLLQEIFGHPRLQVVPGQGLIQHPSTQGKRKGPPLPGQKAFSHKFVSEMLPPSVEPAPQSLSDFQGSAQPAVPPGEDPLQKAQPRVGPFEIRRPWRSKFSRRN